MTPSDMDALTTAFGNVRNSAPSEIRMLPSFTTSFVSPSTPAEVQDGSPNIRIVHFPRTNPAEAAEIDLLVRHDEGSEFRVLGVGNPQGYGGILTELGLPGGTNPIDPEVGRRFVGRPALLDSTASRYEDVQVVSGGTPGDFVVVLALTVRGATNDTIWIGGARFCAATPL